MFCPHSVRLYLSGLAELECAGLLGDNGALVLGLQLGDQLGLQAAGLLGVQVTHLLGDINQRGQNLADTRLNRSINV